MTTGEACPLELASGDFNGDGLADIIATHAEGGVNLWLGVGGGDLQSRNLFGAGPFQNDVRVADFNNDAHLDIFRLSPSESFARISLGNGNGTFQPQSTVSVGASSALFLFVEDISQDGRADIMVKPAFNVTKLLVNSPSGAFTTQDADDFDAFEHVLAKDINDDGLVDLIGVKTPEKTIRVTLGLGGGLFAAPVDSATGATPNFLLRDKLLADVNGDSLQDLFLVDSPELYLALGNGDGTFQTATALVNLFGSQGVSLMDTNNDEAIDILIADEFNTLIIEGNGDGTFSAPAPADVVVLSVLVADVNDDGIDDLIETPNQILLGNGDGTFQPINATFLGELGMEVADFNEDGALDLYFSQRGLPPNTVEIVFGNGDGTFQSGRPLQGPGMFGAKG